MQNPDEDTEWNDILRAKGILPQKEVEVTEDDLTEMIDEAARKQMLKEQGKKDMEDMSLEELNEVEDDEDERVWLEYRAKRLAELKERQKKARFGSIKEISAEEYRSEVNDAGEGIWVILHLYKTDNLICRRLQGILQQLASKFPAVKFLQSVSTRCIPNYPDKNLPTIFVYHEGDLKKQYTGPHIFGGQSMTADGVEWALAQVGAVESDIEDPRDTLMARTLKDLRVTRTRVAGDSESDDDSDSD
ncbi:hypothetical protein PTSG_08141 [Salpingoeca rosetta]|uniref:Phosducin domain-containing protein n=1 Tax=Salpingoeca rosetta (strain ATCC 50818 / BSB-021) TaxID=946362 RepID=F2UI41_SALR5|nr:uncharacterized protein PTSG_08141 [Salpingoeca rosetta]EGD76790.1 hypothetical protein PTSG_08141 [Salpingoeca rosetta]|eukprot:XP_004991162.1 hypothetical protein PTSG_08141 [Salpingoeca rosetta]